MQWESLGPEVLTGTFQELGEKQKSLCSQVLLPRAQLVVEIGMLQKQ